MFCERQCIQYCRRGGRFWRLGIIVNVYDNGIDIVLVKSLEFGDKCYDDDGAIYELHKDNVRLRGCPPPFQSLYRRTEVAYCHADMNNLVHIKSSDYEQYHVTVIDDGAMVSESMMNEIKYHPWIDHLQKEKTKFDRLFPESDCFDDEHCYGYDGPEI